MSKHSKTLERMRNHPRDWQIDNLLTIARQYGISVRNNGGSHYVFWHTDVEDTICVPAHRPIKPVYVRQFVALVIKIKELINE